MADACLFAIRRHLLSRRGRVPCPPPVSMTPDIYMGSFVLLQFALSLHRQKYDCERRRQSLVSEERYMLDSQLDLLQQHLIVEKGLSRNTLAAYMSDLQHFGMFVRTRGASIFQDLSREDVIAYLAERRKQGIAARNLAREL